MKLEKARGEKRQEELQEALNALARDAHQATRNLDDTYYSLLEKLAALRSTLSSLQKLSASAETARSEFGRDAEGLADELERSTRGFAGFEAQGRSVDELVERLRRGKERSKGLEERLERCRESVEEWETREREERKRKNRRDWFVWSMVAAALVLLVAFAVWRKSAQVRLGVAGVGGGELKRMVREVVPDLMLEEHSQRGRVLGHDHGLGNEHIQARQTGDRRWDRVLDEL